MGKKEGKMGSRSGFTSCGGVRIGKNDPLTPISLLKKEVSGQNKPVDVRKTRGGISRT